MTQQLASYLRTHRKKSGLSQRELAYVLGYNGKGQISRHEQRQSVPPLFIALAYEAIFRVPVSELFPGFYQTAVQAIETRLGELENALQQKSGHASDAKATARKLEWMWERRTGIEI